MELFLTSLILLFFYMSVLFIIAQLRNNNGIADIGYGIGFVVVALSSYMLGPQTITASFATVLVVVWGSRLACRIYRKNHGKPEDFRYAAWRASWQWFRLRSFFQIYMLQGLIIFSIVSPVMILNASSVEPHWIWLVLAVLVWCKGFYFEAVGDAQLDAFISDQSSKGKLMTAGLWSLTRHPNYFGESIMWHGIWVMAVTALAAISWWIPIICYIASPLLITYLLLKVSGVPMLEAAMEKKEGWKEYAAATPSFIPDLKKSIQYFLHFHNK